MLRSLKDIMGYKLATPDGEVGKCKDCLFDDDKWTVRYLDIDTGSWLPGRRVLVSPISLSEPDWQSQQISTFLSKEKIEKSPGLDENTPVSRQWEDSYYSYYRWPHYAVGGYLWGFSTYPKDLIDEVNKESPNRLRGFDPNLRSIQEVLGYEVLAKDDAFGSVDDFIFDGDTWTIRYLVINTIKYFPSKKVLVSPSWSEEITWPLSQIKLSMTKDEIVNSPSFDESAPVNKEYEVRLYDYYGRPKYWEKDLSGGN